MFLWEILYILSIGKENLLDLCYYRIQIKIPPYIKMSFLIMVSLQYKPTNIILQKYALYVVVAYLHIKCRIPVTVSTNIALNAG